MLNETIIELGISVVVGAVWLFSGFQIIRITLPRQSFFTILALGGITGEVVYLVLLNALAYVQSFYWASMTAIGILAAVGVITFYLNRVRRPQSSGLEFSPAQNVLLCVVFALIVGLYAVNFFFGDEINFDPYFHQPLAATIAEGNFPPRHPFNPNYAAQDHYGIDLLAASLIRLGGVAPWNAINIVVLWNLAATFLLAVRLGSLIVSGSFFAGIFSAIFLFFGGTWAYIGALFHSSMLTERDLISDLISSYGISLLHNPTSLAVPTVLAVLCLLFFVLNEPNNRTRISLMILMTVVLGSLALSSEEKFVLIVWGVLLCALVAWGLLRRKREYHNILFIVMLALFLGCVLSVFQGGVITEAIFGSPGAHLDSSITAFQLRTIPGFVFWSQDFGSAFSPLLSIDAFIFLFSQFGPLPLLAPIFVVVLWRQFTGIPHRMVVGVMAVAATSSFLIPLFIEYPVSDVNFTRVFGLFRDMGNLFLGMGVGAFIAMTITHKRQQLVLIIGGIFFLTYIYAPLLYNVLVLNRQAAHSAWGWSALPAQIEPIDLEIAQSVKKIVPQESRVLTNNIIAIPTLWGRFAPYAMSRERVDLFDPTFISLFPQPRLEDLLRLKISYIFVSPFKEDRIYNENPPAFLRNGLDKNYLQAHPEWFEFIRNWDEGDKTYVLYHVRPTADSDQTQ